MKKLFAAALLLTALASAPAQATTGLGFADTSTIAGGQSLSALFNVNDNWIQGFLGVHQTKGNFDFAVGGGYKLTVIGNRNTGFHVGPMASIGTFGGDFAFTIMAGAGAHFTLFDKMMLSFDGGPMYVHTQAAKNFRMKPMGELLGMSVHYLF